MRLNEAFERVVVISLPHRHERLSLLFDNLAMYDLGLVEVVKGIDGRLGTPVWFDQGPGAWGLWLTAIQIYRRAIRDKVASLLILEDDAVFRGYTASVLPEITMSVPNDWGQLYLGGEHLLPPEPVPGLDRIVRGRNINRTHACAYRGSRLQEICWWVETPPKKGLGWHLDHHLGDAHLAGLWPVYAVHPWLAGQREGQSDISGRIYPVRYFPWPPVEQRRWRVSRSRSA